MKKVFVLIATVLMLGFFQEAQALRLKVKPVQYYWQSGGGNYSIGIGFEKADGGMLGIQHNLDLDFNGLNPLFRYRPEFRFYVMDEAPSGFYVGPYLTIGGTTASNFGSRAGIIAYGVGAQVGYQLMLADDKFSIDVQYAFGMGGAYTIVGAPFNTNNIGFAMIPNLGVGFHF